MSALEILRVSGDPAVAEVAVARFRGDDRHTVEIVDGLAPPATRAEKWILNLSTQFGCPVGCPFCDAASDFAGNPTAEELLAQVRWGLDRHPGEALGCKKLKVHFARMGEPALNDQVLEAIAALPDLVPSRGVWCCLATVAPRGREPFFEGLLRLKERHFRGRFQLQFSIQSTDPAARARLIPIRHWDLQEIAAFGRRFHRQGDRTVVLNFALAEEVPFDPGVIRGLFDPACFAIKITPVNPTVRGAENEIRTVLRSERASRLEDRTAELRARGFDVVWSVGDPREDEVGSNCGQAVRRARALAAAG